MSERKLFLLRLNDRPYGFRIVARIAASEGEVMEWALEIQQPGGQP